jgi:hypothetical protein
VGSGAWYSLIKLRGGWIHITIHYVKEKGKFVPVPRRRMGERRYSSTH